MQGYRQTNSFVVTQWPQKNTINDIWRLFYDYNIPTVVLLNDMPFTRVSDCLVNFDAIVRGSIIIVIYMKMFLQVVTECDSVLLSFGFEIFK